MSSPLENNIAQIFQYTIGAIGFVITVTTAVVQIRKWMRKRRAARAEIRSAEIELEGGRYYNTVLQLYVSAH